MGQTPIKLVAAGAGGGGGAENRWREGEGRRKGNERQWGRGRETGQMKSNCGHRVKETVMETAVSLTFEAPCVRGPCPQTPPPPLVGVLLV